MKIGYSKTYPITSNGQWEKIWLEHDTEGSLSEPEIRTIQYALKKQVENFHYESNKAAEKQNEPIEKPDGIIELINKCTTIPKPHGILAYEIIAKTNKSIQDAWDMKFKELSQQTK